MRRPSKKELGRSRAIANALGILGYPGFFTLLTELEREMVEFEPAVVLTAALTCDYLEPEVAEALPWLVLRFPELDWPWLIREARTRGTQNRLGYIVTLALRHGAASGLDDERLMRLTSIEEDLFSVREEKEDTLCHKSLAGEARDHLRQNRPEEARLWNLLCEIRPDALPF